MAYSVSEMWTQAFENEIRLLVQQRNPVLGNTVTVTAEEGEYIFEDRIAPVTHIAKTTSNQATAFADVTHTKRQVTFTDKTLNLYIDDRDVKRMGRGESSILGAYSKQLVADYHRTIDDIIIAAFLAAADEGKGVNDTFSSVAFDTANQVIAADFTAGDAVGDGNGSSSDTYGTGDWGLTLEKLLVARSILEENNAIQSGEEVYCVIGPREHVDLMKIPEYKSSDFSKIMPYDMGIDPNGYIGNWLGVHFLCSNRLAVTDPAGANNQYRSNFMFTSGAMKLRKVGGQVIKAMENPERNMALTINSQFSLGAVRLEEEKVVEIRTASGMAGGDAA
jgi:hypothetical protein